MEDEAKRADQYQHQESDDQVPSQLGLRPRDRDLLRHTGEDPAVEVVEMH
jgi:hypothetical protein